MTINKVKNNIMKCSKSKCKKNFISNQNELNYINVSNIYYKNTVVDICRIYSDISKKILIGFSFSNCYGAKAYIKNEINQPIQFLYRSYVKRILDKNGLDIQKEKDISYLFHRNKLNPITLVSRNPFVKVNNLKESILNSFLKFIKHINGNPDPSNEGKVFLIHYLPDYILDTMEKKKTYLHICTANKIIN